MTFPTRWTAVGRSSDEPVGVGVHHDHLLAVREQVVGRGATDAAVAADDHVTAQLRDPVVHATPFEVPAEVTLGQCLEDHAEVVENGAHPDDDQHDREHDCRRGDSGWTSRKPTVETVVTVW